MKNLKRKRLRAVRSVSEEEGTRDLRQQFIAGSSHFQRRTRFSPAQASGSTSLGWYRGHQTGIFDAYLTLKEAYPEAAEALIKAFGMSLEGSY